MLALAPFGRFNVSGSPPLCNQVVSPKSKVLLVQLQFGRLIKSYIFLNSLIGLVWGFSDVDHEWSSSLKEYNVATFVASLHLV